MSICSEILKDLRSEQGLTQKELSKKIGITASAIGFLENGQREPMASTLLAYANYFGVSIDYLMGREQDDNGYYQNLPEKKKAPIAERTQLSEIQENFISEFKEFFSEKTFWKYAQLYQAMDRDTRIFALGYLCSYLKNVGMNVDAFLK
ncbi:MAG TPA: helix-turn-helix transcriptional regulator [Candidatus Borkfalkia avistercoris]|uniref:Helix-turn-helix transcriptional regulator n=1 Tax=Candidatus Borkfalkia avistercoris TaxID=2838504 RepID=A0A9D2IEH2_9FIRM|nr:helix-turn-helix transcriptional regulator [Candidatus Borkfalkia avistercoris]